MQQNAGVPSWAQALISDGTGMVSDAGIPGLDSLDIFSRIPVNPSPYYFVGAVPCESLLRTCRIDALVPVASNPSDHERSVQGTRLPQRSRRSVRSGRLRALSTPAAISMGETKWELPRVGR